MQGASITTIPKLCSVMMVIGMNIKLMWKLILQLKSTMEHMVNIYLECNTEPTMPKSSSMRRITSP